MRQNPFKPTAGMNPPELIGRDQVLQEFLDGIVNGAGSPGRLMRVSGARGMGKTVVLNEIAAIARRANWLVVDETASETLCEDIISRLVSHVSPRRVKVEPSVLGVSLGGAEFESHELTLRDAMTKAIKKNGNGLLITVDEVQDASLDEMRKLAIAIQHIIRDGLDIAFVFAGLPSMIDNVINGKTLTFLRRAVPFELGVIGSREIEASFKETFEASGMGLEPKALTSLVDASRGYPFMIQLVGYHCWQVAARADSNAVTESIVQAGIAAAHDRFDQMVIEPALQHLSKKQVAYLLAMAVDDGVPSESGAVAERMGETVKGLSTTRARLIEEGIIESCGWGEISFAIPYLAEYLNASRDEFEMRLGVGRDA